MKLSHILLAGLLSVSAGYVSAQAQPPALPSPVPTAETAAVTPEEQAALEALQTALEAATTPEQKAQILADAIAQTPSLASNPALSSQVQSASIQSGLSVAQVDSAVFDGLTRAAAPAAGPGSTTGDTPPSGSVGALSGSGGGTAPSPIPPSGSGGGGSPT